MAQQLVESLASDNFDASKYHDEYREQLLDLIERKAAGEEIIAEPETEAPAKVLDLVAALEASLAKASTAKERHPSTAGRKVDIDDDVEDDETSRTTRSGAEPGQEGDGQGDEGDGAAKADQEGAGQEDRDPLQALGLSRRAPAYSASTPSSAVRMRVRYSTGTTHTFPSPIEPVRAASISSSATSIACVVLDEHLQLELGHEVDLVLRSSVGLGLPALAAEAAHVGDGHARRSPSPRAPTSLRRACAA